MSKLKNIIKQLSETDYQTIFDNLMDNSADKSAMLLKYLKEKQLTDAKIMAELDVNPNAYYTLRSRLNEKIEEYLVQEMEGPKTDLLKKVSSIPDFLYKRKRTITIATLKKLEKELLDFDLSSELTIVYKSLKKLHINTPEYFHYSQQYNRHVAYMLALDKAEDLLSDYFKKYSNVFLVMEGADDSELELLLNEFINLSKLYHSHRLFIYYCCVGIFHKLFVNKESKIFDKDGLEISIEDAFEKIDHLMESYGQDANYYHLQLVFDYLKMLYLDDKKVYKKSDKFYHEVNANAASFLSNYSSFTFTPMFLLARIDRDIRMEEKVNILETFKNSFQDIEIDENDISKYIVFNFYKAFTYFFAGKNEQAAKTLNQILNDLVLKKYPEIQLEIKTFLVMQYCLLDDFDLFNQLMNSIQRQIRMMGKKKIEHIALICKAMKIAMAAGSNRQKVVKIKSYLNRINLDKVPYFTPFRHVNYKDEFLGKYSSVTD